MFKLKPIMLVVAIALSMNASVSYAGGAATGGASEVTQIMNNGELIAATSKQAQLVAGQIRDYASQVNQYDTMVQNLKNLPVAAVAATLKPYKATLRDLGELYRAVDDVYAAGTQAYTTYERRKAEMSKMNMSYDQYLNMETLLAASKGGQYKVQYEKDIAALKKLQDKATTLAGMESQINAVSGNVEGLQLLAQQNQIMAGELMELNSQLRQKSAQEAADKELQMKALEGQIKQQKELNAMKAKSNQATLKAIDNGGKYKVDQKRKELFKDL
jgi:type IV secretion system protein TrbJ